MEEEFKYQVCLTEKEMDAIKKFLIHSEFEELDENIIAVCHRILLDDYIVLD